VAGAAGGTRLAEQRTARTGPGLRQLLSRKHTEREAGVHQIGGQPLGRTEAALEHLAEADLLGVGHSLLEKGEGAAVVQIGRVHGVPCAAQLVGERDHPGGQPLRVVEEHYFSHP
jgi:hypothetical protein